MRAYRQVFANKGSAGVDDIPVKELYKYQLVVSAKSWKSLKEKLKIITRKTTPCTFEERIQKLKETVQVLPRAQSLFQLLPLDAYVKEGTRLWPCTMRKLLHILMNRCIRDPYVQWCERLPPSVHLPGQSTRLH